MKHKILLVVGDMDLSNKLVQLCVNAGIHTVDEVSSCAAAMDRVGKTNYNLIVCDDCFADGKIDPVITKIRMSSPSAPIIAFSDDEGTRACLWERGCSAVTESRQVADAFRKALVKLK